MMLQESPKLKGLGRTKKKHPKISIPKETKTSSKRFNAKEWSQPLSKYTKTTMYYSGAKPK